VAKQTNLGEVEQAGYEVGQGAGRGTGPVFELTDHVGQQFLEGASSGVEVVQKSDGNINI